MVYSPEKIKIADRDFGDIEVMPPPTPPWTTVYCAQRIN